MYLYPYGYRPHIPATAIGAIVAEAEAEAPIVPDINRDTAVCNAFSKAPTHFHEAGIESNSLSRRAST